MLWQWATTAGGRRLDLKTLLEQLPKWAGLPPKPTVNNYKTDAQNKVDKSLRVAKQQVLHQLRIQAAIITLLHAEDQEEGQQEWATALQMQLFQYMADCYNTLELERKENSLPGSTKSEDQLFDKEDLSKVKWQSTVNKTYRWGMFSPRVQPLGPYSFRPHAGGKNWFRNANFKGKGKSFGNQSFGRGYSYSSGKSWKPFFGKGKKGISIEAGCHLTFSPS